LRYLPVWVYPKTWTNITYNNGSVDGANSVRASNITSIETTTEMAFDLVDTTVTLAGSITIPLWQRAWIVWFAGTYGSETVNGTNYYGVWYVARDTTTRPWKRWNGTVNTELTAALVTDIDNLAFTSTNAAVTQRWYRMQAIAWLALTTITKNASCTATRALVKTDAWVTLQTLTFSWDVATLTTPQIFQTGDFFRIECDSNAVSFTSRRLLSATFPQTRTNVWYISGSEAGSSAWASGTTAFNIDSVGTELLINNFIYTSSTLSTPKLLSKTNATFTYKLPTDLPRIATEAKSTWDNVIATTLWLNSTFSGLTPLADYYISNTPWVISSVIWTNLYPIWYAIDWNTLNVSRSFILPSSYTTYWATVTHYTSSGVDLTSSVTYVVLKTATPVTFNWWYTIAYDRYRNNWSAQSYDIRINWVSTGNAETIASWTTTYIWVRSIDIFGIKAGDIITIRAEVSNGSYSARVQTFSVTYTPVTFV
jgi:hypothetical protein